MTENTALPVPSQREAAIALFSGEFRNALETIPSNLLMLAPEDLEKKYEPSPMDYFLRKNFWFQVENAQRDGATELTAASVYTGVCHVSTFHNRVIKNPIRLAWMLVHPMQDIDRAEEALTYGLTRLRRDILTLPANEKTAPVILKAVELLWNRVHGPVIQKIQSQHAHINLNKPVGEKIENLKNKLNKRLVPASEEKDVTPSESGNIGPDRQSVGPVHSGGD